MLVLALDTTSEKGGVSIYRDSKCLAAVENQGPANIYSVSLFQMTAQALAEAGIGRDADLEKQAGKAADLEKQVCATVNGAPLGGLSEIDLFTVANGPGSFTGIRVGTAAVQAWAKVFGRLVCGVSVLEAMVEEARPKTEWAIPILDAGRGEFFLGCFQRATLQGPEVKENIRTPAGYRSLEEGWVLRPDSLSNFLREHVRESDSVTCLVRESDRATLALREVLPKSYRWQSLHGTLLGAIARLGLEAGRKGAAQPPENLNACYIRRPDAEINLRD